MEITENTFRSLIKEASLAGRKQLKLMIGLMLALGAGGGGWMYSTHGQLSEQIDSQASWSQRIDRQTQIVERHDRDLSAQGERIDAIAILLVQQGRHFEEMVRSVAPPGTHLPDRPAALDAIEQEIMRRDTRRGR
jgi:uncharacterized protein HemX